MCERFNRTFHEECILGRHIDFTQPIEIIQEEINAWLISYNTDRPHESLDGIPPILEALLLEMEEPTSGGKGKLPLRTYVMARYIILMPNIVCDIIQSLLII